MQKKTADGLRLLNINEFDGILGRIKAALTLLEHGCNFLVFCEKGKHRSSYLCAGIIMAYCGLQAAPVMTFVRSMRPIVEFSRPKHGGQHFAGDQALALATSKWMALGQILSLGCGNLPRVESAHTWTTNFKNSRRRLQRTLNACSVVFPSQVLL